MPEPIKTGLPPDLDLGGNWIIEWDAVDPVTGATVAGVKVSDTSLLASGVASVLPVPLGPYLLVQGGDVPPVEPPDVPPVPPPVPPPPPPEPPPPVPPPPPPPPPVATGTYAQVVPTLTYDPRAGIGADRFAALTAAEVVAAGGRHVVCTTRAQHDAAVSSIRGGDWIDCRGIHFTGTVHYGFSLTRWAKVTYDSACSVTGAPSTSAYQRAISMPHVDYGIFLIDCDVTNRLGGGGILVDRCNHFVLDVLDGHSVHDCGLDGIDLLPQRGTDQGDVQNFFVRGEVHNVCQNPAADVTHAEHGTGIHCCNAADSIGGRLHHGALAVWGHDCVRAGGSVVELGMGSATATLKPHDLDIYIKGARLLFMAQSQTAGNGLNAWGQIGANVTVHVVEVNDMAGHGVHTDSTGGTSKAGVTVLSGSASNYCQNPRYRGQNPWMRTGGVKYGPGPFTPKP